MPIHMLNLVCNMDTIMEVARRHKLLVIEDACQAVDPTFKGRRIGSIGDARAFSFNQFKNLNSGEGGAVLTNNDRYFARARMYHDVGSYTRQYEFKSNEPYLAGVNFRVSELTGAVLYAQLPRRDPMINRLKAGRKVLADALSWGEGVRVWPHNDPENAAGLSIIFDRAMDAEAFAKGRRGVERLIDTGRYVYTKLDPDPHAPHLRRADEPLLLGERDIEYEPNMCQRTLNILQRTCRISLGAPFQLPVIHAQTRRLRAALA